MQVKTQGLIIREQAIGESDRLVTVLTGDEGVVRAFARRAKNLKDSKNAATSLLCYSRLDLYKGRDRYIINDAAPLEVFFGLRRDINALALGQYFCSLAAELVPEGVESRDYLRLVLNALHFLCEGSRPQALLKPIVELRLLSISGFMPDLVCCTHCGAYEAPQMAFQLREGNICCRDCGGEGFPLSPAALKAMRHIVYSELDKVFAFRLGPAPTAELSQAAEAYTVQILQKRPPTLDFYNSLL